MLFRELVLQNFGPYRGRQAIDLQPNNGEVLRPIVLLGGMNGGGKTTLMDAIRLALYGQRAQCSTRGNLSYGEFLAQAVNRHTPLGEETRIELAFERVYEHERISIRVSRTWTNLQKDSRDTLGVSINEWPDPALAKTWDEYIENLLPLGISNLFLFDGEQVKELAELDTPPPAVIEAIQALLGLELAERLAVDLDILINRKRKALANAKDLLELEEIEAKLERQKEIRQELKQEESLLQARVDRAKNKYQFASEKFIAEGGKMASGRSQRQQKIQELEQSLQSQRDELRALAAGILPLAAILPLLATTQNQGEAEAKRHQALLTKDVLEERDRRLLDYLQTLSLDGEAVEKIATFLTTEVRELEAAIATVTEPWLNSDPETLERIKGICHHQLPAAIQFLKYKLSRIQELVGHLDVEERQLAAAAPPELYEQLQTELEKAREERTKLELELELVRRKQGELERQIVQTAKELERYGEQTLDRQDSEYFIEAAMRVKGTLQLFKEKLTLKKLNKLENEVTECFRYLLHKSDLVHRLSIDSHTFALSLFDVRGESVPKHRLSAGEKQLLAIAFLWGLARISGRQLPIAIDTPLGRLDSSHRHNLVGRYFPAASHQVILLSTDTEIARIEYQQLQEQDAIAREYLLEYDADLGQTTVKEGYFW